MEELNKSLSHFMDLTVKLEEELKKTKEEKEQLVNQNKTLKSENSELIPYKTKLNEILKDYSNMEKSQELLTKEIEEKAKIIKNYQDLEEQIQYYKTELEAKNKYLEETQKKVDEYERIGAGEQFEKLSMERNDLRKEKEKLNNQLKEKINEIENQKQQYIKKYIIL